MLESIKDDKEFVLKTMAGLTLNELGIKNDHVLFDYKYTAINPMPNLYFTRDPFSTIGKGVSINTMYSVTRSRETIYADYIFNYHKDYKGTKNYYGRGKKYHIEGGDTFNGNETTLLIGISQRTQYEAIKVLAKKLFFGENENKIEKIYALKIDENRAFMHLDTVFTQIDYDAFTYHPAIIKEMEVKIITKDEANNDLHIETASGKLDEILAGQKMEPRYMEYNWRDIVH